MNLAPARRWPILPTILVALACLTMIALGLWQWQRLGEKNALVALYQRNAAMSSDVSFPLMPPAPDSAMFRRSAVTCLEVTGWQQSGGHSVNGESGFRFLASCRTGVEGPGVLVDMGVRANPDGGNPAWAGGHVAGTIVPLPDQAGLADRLARAIGSAPTPPRAAMLIAADPAPGLMASAPPDPSDLPNNHLAYAVQWFLFAAAAAIIYVLALRQRWRKAASAGDSAAVGV